MYKTQMYIQYANRYVVYLQHFYFMGKISEKDPLGAGKGECVIMKKRLENTELRKRFSRFSSRKITELEVQKPQLKSALPLTFCVNLTIHFCFLGLNFFQM